jgi:transmembrane sensor
LSGQILDEASTWFVEFQEGVQDERTREAFLDWLRASPQHVRAYLQIAAHWEEDAPAARAPDLGGAFESIESIESIEALLAMARREANVVPLARDSLSPRRIANQAAPPPEARAPRPCAAQRRFRFAVAAGVLLAVAAAAVTYNSQREVYATRVGEQRSIRLDDGSTVEINARSRIKIHYTDEMREIDLLEGQALFSVAKSTTRPFVVQAGATRIRALGTQFDVYRKSDRTVVTVVEGRVAVAAAEDSGGTAVASPGKPLRAAARDPSQSEMPQNEMSLSEVLLGAGEQITVSAQSQPKARPQPQSADVAAATAWTQRRLIFTRQSLSNVVAEFNRYNAKPLVIADPSIADTEISGTFSSSDPASLLRFLREVGAYSVRESDSEIEITRR